MGISTTLRAASIAIGLSLLFNAHSRLIEGSTVIGDVYPSLFSGNLYVRILGGLLALFQTCGVLLCSLKPISTQEIHDPTSPHLTGCFDPLWTTSPAPLGSGRSGLIKELSESETFCSYLRDPPR